MALSKDLRAQNRKSMCYHDIYLATGNPFKKTENIIPRNRNSSLYRNEKCPAEIFFKHEK